MPLQSSPVPSSPRTPLSETAERLLQRFARVARRPSVIAVFLLVALWNLSVSIDWLGPHRPAENIAAEALRGLRDVNIRIQLRFYQLLTGHLAIPFETSDVTPINIDNASYWNNPDFARLNLGVSAVNLQLLTDLIQTLATSPARPKVIGLDVLLLGRATLPPDPAAIRDFDTNLPADQNLLDAIHTATRNNIPVVLAAAGYIDPNGRLAQMPPLFSPQLLASHGCGDTRCPSFGFTDLPDDEREIPLTADLLTPAQPLNAAPATPAPHTAHTLNSFALAVAEAAENPMNARRSTLLTKISTPHPFGTFAPDASYKDNSLSAASLLAGNQDDLKKCAGQVVLIGGHWRDFQGYGNMIDLHPTPVGTLSGLDLNANYIESLLHQRWTRELPGWLNLLLDLLVGLVIYAGFEAVSGLRQKCLLLLAAFCLPPLCAYLAIFFAFRYLDFLLPIELYAIHLLYEIVETQLHAHHPVQLDAQPEAQPDAHLGSQPGATPPVPSLAPAPAVEVPTP